MILSINQQKKKETKKKPTKKVSKKNTADHSSTRRQELRPQPENPPSTNTNTNATTNIGTNTSALRQIIGNFLHDDFLTPTRLFDDIITGLREAGGFMDRVPNTSHPFDFVSLYPTGTIRFIQRQPHQQRRLTESQFNSLKRLQFSQLSTAQDKCSICIEDFKNNDLIVDSGCDSHHVFHDKCLKPYVTKESAKCPNCRQELLKNNN